MLPSDVTLISIMAIYCQDHVTVDGSNRDIVAFGVIQSSNERRVSMIIKFIQFSVGDAEYFLQALNPSLYWTHKLGCGMQQGNIESVSILCMF